MSNKNVLPILDRAIELTKTMGWTTEYLCRDADGVPTEIDDEEACSFCTLGFLLRAGLDVTGNPHMFKYDACAAVYKALDNKDIAISIFNDEYAKSVDDITALFEKAKEYV